MDCKETVLVRFTVARELARYKLDLVGVRVRWDAWVTVRAGFFPMEKETKIINWQQNFLYTTD